MPSVAAEPPGLVGLSAVSIRPLREQDIEPTRAAVLEGGWGDRGFALRFYSADPYAHPLVADADGEIVGTVTAIQNGPVGWVGLLFVSPKQRGGGLGRQLTEAAGRILRERGCRSMLLAATELGQPVYRRLGFHSVSEYVVFRGAKLDHPPVDGRVRRIEDRDVEAIVRVDRAVTGEDRAHALRALPHGWVIDNRMSIDAFALLTPFGYGPIVAADPEDGALLLDVVRGAAIDADMQITVPAENTAALAHLRSAGFVEQRRLPRMLLGDTVVWQPTHMWAIFSFAMG